MESLLGYPQPQRRLAALEPHLWGPACILGTGLLVSVLVVQPICDAAALPSARPGGNLLDRLCWWSESETLLPERAFCPL